EVLLASRFALKSPGGGRLFGIGLAIVIMAGYLVVHYVALAFARADLLPPLIAAWTANVIFMGIGLSLLLPARTWSRRPMDSSDGPPHLSPSIYRRASAG